MKAHLRNARLSPKKVNLVASMVRNMPVTDALAMLEKMPKKGAEMLHGTIASAVANAENNLHQQRDSLFVKTLIVNKGPAFRRFIPIARGRARPIDKWTSHITVELGVIVPEGEEVKAEKVEMAETKKEEKKKNPLQAEIVEGPVTQSPGNPAKDTDASDSDSSASGSYGTQGGSTFTPHRQGGRGE